MKQQLKEYDCVIAKRDINIRVKKGTRGCIMMVHSTKSFIVEFFVDDPVGNIDDVLTVTIDDIESWETSFCPLLGREICQGECYDIQMVRNRAINESILGFSLDRARADTICKNCDYNQLSNESDAPT